MRNYLSFVGKHTE